MAIFTLIIYVRNENETINLNYLDKKKLDFNSIVRRIDCFLRST